MKRNIVLLVDDEPGINEVFRKSLSRIAPATEFIVAGDGIEALEMISGILPDQIMGVFLDDAMPNMTGTRLLNILYDEHPHYREIHIIGTSGTKNPAYDTALDQFPNGYRCGKPIRLATLRKIYETRFTDYRVKY